MATWSLYPYFPAKVGCFVEQPFLVGTEEIIITFFQAKYWHKNPKNGYCFNIRNTNAFRKRGRLDLPSGYVKIAIENGDVP